MWIIEYFKDYGVIVNTVILVILFFRHIQDIKKNRLERNKLTLEIEELKKKQEKSDLKIINVSDEEAKKLILENREFRKIKEEMSKLAVNKLESASVLSSNQLIGKNEIEDMFEKICDWMAKIQYQLEKVTSKD